MKNMLDFLWIFLLVVLVVGLPYFYTKKGLTFCVAVAYIVGTVIFTKLFYEYQGLQAIATGFVASAQLFTLGINGKELVEILTAVRHTVSFPFVLCVWASFLICPVLTFSVVLSYIKRGLDRTTLRTRLLKDIYIFSEMNESALVLAKDICKNNKRATVIFANTDSNDAELSVLCVPYTVLEVFSLLNRTNRIKVCFNDCDSGKILDDVHQFLAGKRKKKAEIFVFSNHTVVHEVLDGMKHEYPNDSIRVISTHAILMRDILWDYPLFCNMHQPKELNVSVFGVGDFGGYFAMNTLWCATLPDCHLKLNLVDCDQRENILRRVSDNLPDGYFDIEIFNENINTNSFFQGLSSTRLYDSDYILVAMGNDDVNISISRKIRLYFARCGKNPFIITVLKNQSKFSVMKDILEKEDIVITGGAENLYSYHYIFEDRFFARAFEVFRIVEGHYGHDVCERDFFMQKQIDIFSSYANAIHCKYKIFSLGCGLDAAEETVQEKLDQKLSSLVQAEHDRWVTFEVLKGYVGVKPEDLPAFFEQNAKTGKIHKNDKLKMHALITDMQGVEEVDRLISQKYHIQQNLKEIDEVIAGQTGLLWFLGR